jgi:hypothetical protein
MVTIIINYSESKELLERYSGKFVQIRHGDTEYILFSPRELARFHADIVERFCSERKIEGHYNIGRKSFDIDDPAWVVVGGGKFEWDRKEKLIYLYDDSMAYGKFDAEGLKERIKTGELSDYEVRIE